MTTNKYVSQNGESRNSIESIEITDSIPQIIFNGHLSVNKNQDTVQSITSLGSVRKFLQLLKVVGEKRQERDRERRQSSSTNEYLSSTIPAQNALRKKIAFYTQKYYVYNFFHRPRGFWANSYHMLVFLVVFLCLITTVFSTIKQFKSYVLEFMLYQEIVMITWFGGEFILRLWSSSCKPQYYGWKGKLAFIRSPFRIIDIVVIVVSIVVITLNPENGYEVFAASALRGFHRFYQVIQMRKHERQFRPWRILASVLYSQREQLILTFYICFLALCFAAFLSYLVEKDSNDHFENLAESLWWAVVTLCTVGYGDKVPVTWMGKLFAGIFTVIGVTVFALPAGILGTGLALKMQEEQSERHKRKKKLPAIILIQRCWRCYAANELMSMVTWTSRNQVNILENSEKNAIRFVRKVQFLIAKQAFKESHRSVDIKEILEKYRNDQSIILHRIKQMQSDFNSLIGKVGSNSKRLQESKTNFLTSITRIDTSIKNLEEKFDNHTKLFNLFIFSSESIRFQESNTSGEQSQRRHSFS